jgi:hypothetical protein
VQELGSARVPDVVVVEDVHWADEAALDLLRFLGRRLRDVAATRRTPRHQGRAGASCCAERRRRACEHRDDN